MVTNVSHHSSETVDYSAISEVRFNCFIKETHYYEASCYVLHNHSTVRSKMQLHRVYSLLPQNTADSRKAFSVK